MTPNILICVPAYGNQVSIATLYTTHSIIQMLSTKGIRGGIAAFSYPDVSEARNILLTGWYDGCPDATHLLFIDSDMGFSPAVVEDMLHFNEPLVGAIYTKKTLPIQWAASGLSEADVKRSGNFMTVAGLGMGCFLIRRDAITTMIEKMPEIIDTRMTYHAAKEMLAGRIIRAFDPFDNPNDNQAGKLSEDLAFCQRWRSCGGEVWAALGHDIEHIGIYSYKGNYMKYILEREENKEPMTLVDAAKMMAAE